MQRGGLEEAAEWIKLDEENQILNLIDQALHQIYTKNMLLDEILSSATN